MASKYTVFLVLFFINLIIYENSAFAGGGNTKSTSEVSGFDEKIQLSRYRVTVNQVNEELTAGSIRTCTNTSPQREDMSPLTILCQSGPASILANKLQLNNELDYFKPENILRKHVDREREQLGLLEFPTERFDLMLFFGQDYLDTRVRRMLRRDNEVRSESGRSAVNLALMSLTAAYAGLEDVSEKDQSNFVKLLRFIGVSLKDSICEVRAEEEGSSVFFILKDNKRNHCQYLEINIHESHVVRLRLLQNRYKLLQEKQKVGENSDSDIMKENISPINKLAKTALVKRLTER
ncbi:MAG: hypothetical protein HOI80_04395 [Alphaproteobacteria bacterium]|jgi:hypothetical protein|nr:hypothetical protein [Alphaproteobacteria bacterium]MBT5389656.1 hypothetical protein [Alphaproteobacteria bacterium]MBT5540393.1 hypothetical protein [Alphaproteobacteria bacterium]MBT5654723.1 hypothetical protein [Alphaproteobacteria bacterium]